MKKWMTLLLVCTIAAACFGCGYRTSGIKEPVSFFYTRYEYHYGSQDSVIAAETREASGHAGDLNYLLALYLSGPLDEDLTSPFPAGTRLTSAIQEDNILLVELESGSSTITDHKFSLACACMAQTCLNMTDAAQITIVCGDKNVTMTRESLTLYDDVLREPEE